MPDGPVFHLNRDDSRTLDFVLYALVTGAINVKELRQWADYVVMTAPSYPPWLIEVAQFDGRPGDLLRIIGFPPVRSFKRAELGAFAGIAWQRGRAPIEFSKEKATKALAANPHIQAEFASTFPFLSPGG